MSLFHIAIKIASDMQTGYIKKEKGEYCVKSEKNPDWNGGCYDTKGEAEDRLKTVEMFKHMKKAADIMKFVGPDLEMIETGYDNVLSKIRKLVKTMDPNNPNHEYIAGILPMWEKRREELAYELEDFSNVEI